MLTASRALRLNAKAGRPLPRVDALEDLYALGIHPREGQVIMIAGRSGSMKTMFALNWLIGMKVPTLYFAADMSAADMSKRLATILTGDPADVVENGMDRGGQYAARYISALDELPFTFSFGAPISGRQMGQEIDAWVHLWDAFPPIVVCDNLMDVEGAESDYQGQMAAMSNLTDIARDTGSTVIILHHASDKSWDAKTDPWAPPSRDQVKGGMSEKPELSLSVAFNNRDMLLNVTAIKQRSGWNDPTAQTYAQLKVLDNMAFVPYRDGFREHAITSK